MMKPLKRKYAVGITLTNGEIDRVEKIRAKGYGNKEIFMLGIESLEAKDDVDKEIIREVKEENDPDYQKYANIARRGKVKND